MSKPLSDTEVLEKAARFCAYQERSVRDLRKRLYDWGVTGEKADRVIEDMRSENFLDETRFAVAFTRGRFRMKQWGKSKIRYHLLQHGISDTLVHEALDTLNEDEYKSVLGKLFQDRVSKLRATPDLKEKSRVFRNLQSRGFEPDLIHEYWKKSFPDS